MPKHEKQRSFDPDALLSELDADERAQIQAKEAADAATPTAASYDVVAEIHHYTSLMLLNRAKECVDTGEWDPSLISNALKLLNSEGVRAKREKSPLAEIDGSILDDLNFEDLGSSISRDTGDHPSF
jgi:hypothetical protein